MQVCTFPQQDRVICCAKFSVPSLLYQVFPRVSYTCEPGLGFILEGVDSRFVHSFFVQQEPEQSSRQDSGGKGGSPEHALSCKISLAQA